MRYIFLVVFLMLVFFGCVSQYMGDFSENVQFNIGKGVSWQIMLVEVNLVMLLIEFVSVFGLFVLIDEVLSGNLGLQ